MPAFTDAQLEDIQGFGLAGFSKDRQEIVAVRINSVAGGQQLFSWLATQAADAFAVSHFNTAFSEVARRTGVESLKATWTAVMVSAAGLTALGIPVTDLPTSDGATAFLAGMAARAAEIGDEQTTDQPAQWLAPFQPGANQVHLLVVVASDDVCDLDRQLLRVYEHVQACDCDVVFRERGATLPQPLTGHEHFGFKDGISQPAIVGDDSPPPGAPPSVPPGEFVLGYPDSQGNTLGTGTKWQDGSYVVFRRLRQDVARFRQIVAAGVPDSNPAVAGDLLGAKMLGRWKSGAPIEEFPDADPGPGHEDNAFAYQQDDAAGQTCPVWAHVRKANPRDENAPGGQPAGSELHRMIRRGIPFGPPLPDCAPADDGIARGLHFFAMVSDVARQFEFVQSNWMNNPNFPIGSVPAEPNGPYAPPTPGTPAGGPDPVVGEHDPNAVDTLAQGSTNVAFPLGTELVSVTAGEYFFLPSISSLASFGIPPAPPAPPAAA
jgi:Dyp-type peroxidase family